MAKRSRGRHGARSGNPAVRAQRTKQPVTTPAERGEGPARYDPQLPEALPPDGAEYPQILRGPSYVWWRSLLGAVCGLALYILVTAVVTQVVLGLAWTLRYADEAYADFARRALDFEVPAGMIAANLGIAMLIPITWLLMAIVHQVRPRWLSSVQPRLRWRYLLLCGGVAFVVLNGVTLVSTALGPGITVAPQAGFGAFLVVILLTAPLQAAAEEVFFRGYLMQTLGSLVSQPWFGVVVSALVFALMHGGQNPALFLNRLGFGLLAGLLVWRSGGLEAGIAAHVVNNVCAYVLAGLTSSISAVRGVDQIGWAQSGIQLGAFALFTILALLLARRLRLRTRVDLASGR